MVGWLCGGGVGVMLCCGCGVWWEMGVVVGCVGWGGGGGDVWWGGGGGVGGL